MIQTRHAVLWGQLDALGHVNNTVYFRWFEEARIALLDRVGLRAQRTTTGVGPILANTSCQYRLPLVHPDTVTVDCWVERITSERHGQIAAEGDSVVVNYDYATQAKAPLAAPVREALRALIP
jgi:acyl-CoA thioester hydrolase